MAMPLESFALTTLDALPAKTVKGKEDTAARMIHAVSDAMAAYIGRAIHYDAAAVERPTPKNWARIRLRRLPIVSLTSIEYVDIDDTVLNTVTLTDVRVNLETGRITYPGGWSAHYEHSVGIMNHGLPGTESAVLKVTFAGGWVTPAQAESDSALTRTLPYDIEQACVASASSAVQQHGRDQTIGSKSTEQVSTSWRSPNKIIGIGPHLLLPETRSTLDAYAAPVVR